MALPASPASADREVIARVRDQWKAIAASTAPVDRAATAAAVRRLYRSYRLRQPSLTIWMDSPLGCVYAAAVVGRPGDRLRDCFLDGLRHDQVRRRMAGREWSALTRQIRDGLGDQLGDRLRWPLGSALEDELSGALSARLSRPLWDQLRGQIKGRLDGQLLDGLGGAHWDEFWGQFGGDLLIETGAPPRPPVTDDGWDEIAARSQAEHLHSMSAWNDAAALAFDRCLRPAVGLPADPRLDALAAAAAAAGWLIALPDAVVVGARPVVLRLDARGDPHSPNGLAVAYPDGWGFHAWHGRHVPRWVIEAPSIEAIAAEANVEVRRCAIESLGWDRFIAEAGLAPVADPEPDPGNPGQHLALYDLPERLWGGRIRLLMCTNGTPERDGVRRRYGLKVPAHVGDPVEAAAWTAGLSRDAYARMVRRT